MSVGYDQEIDGVVVSCGAEPVTWDELEARDFYASYARACGETKG